MCCARCRGSLRTRPRQANTLQVLRPNPCDHVRRRGWRLEFRELPEVYCGCTADRLTARSASSADNPAAMLHGTAMRSSPMSKQAEIPADPRAFIPVAESTGRVIRLCRYTMMKHGILFPGIPRRPNPGTMIAAQTSGVIPTAGAGAAVSCSTARRDGPQHRRNPNRLAPPTTYLTATHTPAQVMASHPSRRLAQPTRR